MLDKWRGIGDHGEMLDTPYAIAAAIIAVILVGLAKGGLSGLGALATPIMALAMPPFSLRPPLRIWCDRMTKY